jgi:ribosomal protein S18 acetylase RimI-like enzyme
MLGAMRGQTVNRCLAARRADALQLLSAARDPTQQVALAQCVDAAAGDESAWNGLFVVGEPRPTGAIWVQLTAGNTAVIWPPPSNDPAVDALFSAAVAFADERRIGVTQLIVPAGDGFTTEAMGERGFSRLAELLYLFADLSRPATQKSHSSQLLQFQANAGNNAKRLAAVIERTYQHSLDCPALDGARSMDEVLDGYRAQGAHRPNQWYLVTENGHDVGVLLLADHPSVGNWELAYMGVVPEARGRRLGETIARFAQDAARQSNAKQLVLAVDAANEPALEMYRRCGFREWERRTVYARLAASVAPLAKG